MKTISLYVVAYVSLRVDVRPVEWDDVVLVGDPNRCGDRRVHAQGFADDGLQIRERVELVHRRVLCRRLEELLAEAILHTGVLGERKEAPCGRGRRCLMSCDEKSVRTSARIQRVHE